MSPRAALDLVVAEMLVSCSGDNFAASRISSEYALPMPENSRGSVSARLSV